MSRLEAAFCRSYPWRFVARRLVLPWALMGEVLQGSVLEIGGGSGASAAELLRRFPAVSLTVTDVDARMVEQARELLRPFGQRAAARQADATALPFADGEFEAVISLLMLHHVGAWEKALAETVRVLIPGGRLLACDFLDGGLLRGSERLVGSAAVRPIAWSRLQDVLRELPLEEVTARTTGRAMVRLRAAKENRAHTADGTRRDL